MHFLSPLTALAPLGVYLFFLGIINLSSKTRVLTGRQDFIALSLGISGLIIIGPMQVFLPQAGMIRFGNNVWYPMAILYLFGTTWLLLLNRPRLILYNLGQDKFSALMESVVERKKWSVRWHGNILQINEIEIQFEILPSVSMKNITLRATYSEQSIAGWRILREVLRTELQSQHSKFNGFGFLLITCGLIIVVVGWAWTSLV